MKINEMNTVTWNSGDDIYENGNTSENGRIKSGKVDLTSSSIKKWNVDTGDMGLTEIKLRMY